MLIFWDELHEEVKRDIDLAVEELDKGERVPHDEVMKKYDKWLKK